VSLKNLKPGDKVFVVWRDRANEVEVERIGRKYGYLLDIRHRFDLDDGESDGKAWSLGFRVYATEAEYRQQTKAIERFRELAERLGYHVTSLKALDQATVEAIHKILDEAGK